MPNAINITIKNKSTAPQAFLLFQALPAPSNVPAEQVFTNVYQQSPTISGSADDKVTFQILNEYYGIYGTNTASPDQKVKISTSGSAVATLQSGTVNGSTFHLTTLNNDGKSPTFRSTEQTTTALGAFTIQSDGTFNVANMGNIYLGVGAKDPKTGEVIPIQTYKAQPNITAVLYPVVKYYIAFGNYTPGTVVKMSEMGRVLSVDFTGISLNDVTFTLNDHNDYILDPAQEGKGLKYKTDPVTA
ncbi:hypothetical protein LX32DRAFT_565831 [Colletotrichum zoysiae]|uniref:Uncharacterized protein n=1 Tax=Colletotrichum zoysiae TaxID=1216348 RepID=A0AAD9HCQ8_9PEZI|nr:hypothetical protein LX32DRAFT_565831 [Colletotrichum zoysiae]